jgi:hypothetical protein
MDSRLDHMELPLLGWAPVAHANKGLVTGSRGTVPVRQIWLQISVPPKKKERKKERNCLCCIPQKKCQQAHVVHFSTHGSPHSCLEITPLSIGLLQGGDINLQRAHSLIQGSEKLVVCSCLILETKKSEYRSVFLLLPLIFTEQIRLCWSSVFVRYVCLILNNFFF